MQRSTLISVFTSICCWQAAAQGWALFGPDSSNWQNIREINARWFGTDSVYVAASADAGIALKLAGRNWNYSLYDIGDGTHIPFTLYRSLHFSPWEPDSAFIAYEIMVPDPAPQVLKIAVPCPSPPFWSGDLGGACFQVSPGMFSPVERDSLMYAIMCGVYKSVRPWRTWVPMLDTQYRVPLFLVIDRLNPSVLWTGLSGGGGPSVLRSGDGGTSWDTITSFPFLPNASAIAASGDTLLLSQWAPGDTAAFKGITRSTDGGKTWTPRYIASGVRVLRWRNSGTVFAGGPSGILISEDAGSTWQTFNNGLPGTLITDMAVDPSSDTLLVSVLNYGVLKVWSYLVNIATEPPRAVRFALEQNYPNPFNPKTNIRYQIADSRLVRLGVYDILGREVAVLVNEVKQPGAYVVEFDGARLSTGVYVYRLNAGQNVEQRKMVLLR